MNTIQGPKLNQNLGPHKTETMAVNLFHDYNTCAHMSTLVHESLLVRPSIFTLNVCLILKYFLKEKYKDTKTSQLRLGLASGMCEEEYH